MTTARTRPLRALLYHRVSSTDQDPRLARDELRAAARARSMKIVDEIEETGSGARNDRPGLQRALEKARKGAIDAFIVWKLDRAGRSALDLLTNIRDLQQCGVRFISISQGLDIGTDGDAMSKLLLNMLAAIAEFERELIRERTRLGLAKARRLGHKIGRPCSRRTPDRDRVLALRADGVSWREVARRLRCPVTAAWRAARSKNGPRRSNRRSRRGTT